MFNQLCIPCFAAVGAIRNEMKSGSWTAFALIYQMVFSYTIALMIFQFGSILFLGTGFTIWTAVALVVLASYIYLLFRKDPNKVNISKAI